MAFCGASVLRWAGRPCLRPAVAAVGRPFSCGGAAAGGAGAGGAGGGGPTPPTGGVFGKLFVNGVELPLPGVSGAAQAAQAAASGAAQAGGSGAAQAVFGGFGSGAAFDKLRQGAQAIEEAVRSMGGAGAGPGGPGLPGALSPIAPFPPFFSGPQLVGSPAPDFTASAVLPSGEIADVSLRQYVGEKHVLLLFYPLDFTFVCPTELLAFDRRVADFEQRGVQVLGCSVDSAHAHRAWRAAAVADGGVGPLRFPLLADLDKRLARAFNVLAPAGDVALRGLFLIEKGSAKVVHAVVNDLPLGRSVDEALRVVDALDHFREHGEVCPADWKKGGQAFKPTTEGLKEFLSRRDN